MRDAVKPHGIVRNVTSYGDDAELTRRRAEWSPPPLPARGWRPLYAERVLPTHLGADLDFLVPQQNIQEQ